MNKKSCHKFHFAGYPTGHTDKGPYKITDKTLKMSAAYKSGITRSEL